MTGLLWCRGDKGQNGYSGRYRETQKSLAVESEVKLLDVCGVCGYVELL